MSRNWSDEDLRKAVANSVSVAGVIRSLGFEVHAGHYKTVNKYIALLGIDTSHFTGQAWVGTREFHPKKKRATRHSGGKQHLSNVSPEETFGKCWTYGR